MATTKVARFSSARGRRISSRRADTISRADDGAHNPLYATCGGRERHALCREYARWQRAGRSQSIGQCSAGVHTVRL